MRINHNIAALNTYRQLGAGQSAAAKNMEKLSSGLRINRAGDDAAGLAISEKMRGQIRGLEMASKNSQDAISMIQTAEGALNETHSILQRMRELAVQASNDTNTATDRQELQKEIDQLTEEIDRIANTTEFNTKTLLNGDFGTKAVSGTPANVEVKSALASTINEGSYSVVVTNAAVQGSETGDADINTAAVTITEGTNDTLVLNGVTIKFEAGNYTSSQIINKINEYKDQTGLEASLATNSLKLTNTSFGTQTNTIAGNAQGTLLGTVTSVAGEDAAITVDGVAVGVSVDENDGRVLTVTDGALKGIVLNAKGADSSTATLTVNKDELTMQIGANEGQSLQITMEDMRAASLGVDAIDVTTADKATDAITTINNALESVSSERSKLGAYQNRLEHTINNLGTSAENLTAAESRIRDVDMAKEMMEFTKNNILSQAAQAMLAQANSVPQGVLQLLQ
ncbi:MAG TPA: flagellin [Bacillus sp. (in: firmicutes)]|uniref:flagellin N-terminal helical domain-containing protein n=1 Tax=Bacillus litorisediminis TaxID=2922713 RepID=UPI001FAD8039|nr:flagellin [Bacillus litorisediminis]HWO77290.1 flagellin [Bacillus sp. (in: firmicutes)]